MPKNNAAAIYEAKEVFGRKLPFLMGRSRITSAIRGFFERDGFIEVDTPILQESPGMEVHLNAFETRFVDITGRESIQLYLHTSPEFAMKKLLARGMEKIYQFARVFRNEVVSPTHYPEFIMLEWYRAGETYEKLMDDCGAILMAAVEASGHGTFEWRGVKCDPFHGLEKLTIAEAFEKFCGFDVMGTIDNPDAPEAARIKEEAGRLGLNTSESDTWDDVFDKLMFEFIEPKCGAGRPTILYEYPIHMAALSKPLSSNPQLAQRFELYACGVELANAFSELTDPEAQEARFAKDMAEKERLYGKRYPVDREFIEAVGHMPDCAGIALGIDRLAMLALGAADIKDMQWVPIETIEKC